MNYILLVYNKYNTVLAFSVCDDPDYFYDYVQGLLDGLEAGVDSRDIVNIQNVRITISIINDFPRNVPVIDLLRNLRMTAARAKSVYKSDNVKSYLSSVAECSNFQCCGIDTN
ncbi:unnamed protein product [Prunus armeniaca]|uniref:Uncharacterized protein n=1 Tax=Prunus armeniaca TaxID=36596 RepID=A0A6J5VSN6_PRUAR|nr:unnamed protein product [Prunus armeniaca]